MSEKKEKSEEVKTEQTKSDKMIAGSYRLLKDILKELKRGNELLEQLVEKETQGGAGTS